MSTANVEQTDENPYFKTYLRNHKDIKLPKSFGKNDASRSKNPTFINKNRIDYKTLPKVKLFSIKNILSQSECDTLINLSTKIGYGPISFEYPEEYRKCERVICKSFDLASILWKRVIPYFVRGDIEDIRPYGFGNSGIWRPTHINEAIRFTRYRNNDMFAAHRDGGYSANNLNRSVYTIMIYLNDSSNNDFDGGETVFYSLKNSKDSSNPSSADVLLTDDDICDATEVRIKPVTGMCLIFNHDIWHKGCQVATRNAKKYKFICRSDIMFECYDCESFNRAALINDPLYIRAQKYYKATIDLQNEGKVRESTISYLKALSIQTMLPSVIVDKQSDEYYGAEYYWFTNDVYEYIFSYLDVYRLVTVCYVSRAWNYYGTAPNLWKHRYNEYFNINEIEHESRAMYDNTVWLRPWKHIFSYRVMIKNEFPIIVLNMWLNGIEIGSSSKPKQAKNDTSLYYNNDQQLMIESGNRAQYVPFATAEYKQSNMWSWKPYRKEILFGRVIYAAADNNLYGFTKPEWVINKGAVLNGLLFHKLFKQLLYFPNVVVSLPAIMYDNELFVLYLKYMLTKFENQKYSKVFCVMIKNMEQEIAKYYRQENCIIIVNEHRTFSISVIKNAKRIINNAKLMKKYIANERIANKNVSNKCFPNEYFHYRDDYDSSYFIANGSNFDFVSSVNDKTTALKQHASQKEQRDEALPEIAPYHWSRDRHFKYINCTTTAPEPVACATTNDDLKENNDIYYYQIGAKDEELQDKMLNRMKSKSNGDHMHLLETQSANLMCEFANDIFVGPNKGCDIPQNDDFKHLTNMWNDPVNHKVDALDSGYYLRVNAPNAAGFCYSAFDLVLALRDLLRECVDCDVFDEIQLQRIPVIVVGPLTNFYGIYIDEFCAIWNEECDANRFSLQYMKEYVQNEGTRNIKDRSSALQQILQTVVTPQEISNFKAISEIKNEIMQYEIVKKKKQKKEKKESKPKKKGSRLYNLLKSRKLITPK